MTFIMERFKSYNYLTKVFIVNFLFLSLSAISFFDTLFSWGILFISATAVYHLYKVFNHNKNVSVTSTLLSQEEFDNGKNDFELFFFLTCIVCLGAGLYLSLVGLIVFFVAKSFFINNQENLIFFYKNKDMNEYRNKKIL